MTVAVEVLTLSSFCEKRFVGEGVANGALDAGGAGGPRDIDHIGVAFAAFLAVAEVDDGDAEGGGLDDAAGGISDEEGAVLEELPEVRLGEAHGEGRFLLAKSAEDGFVAGVVVWADGGEGQVCCLERTKHLQGVGVFLGFVRCGGV